MRISIQDENHFIEDDLKFVQLLELDDEFEAEIKKIRDKWEIPEEGMDQSEIIPPLKNIDDLPEYRDRNTVADDAYELVKLHRRPRIWVRTFLSIILYGIAVPPARPASIMIVQTHRGFELILREKVSIREIKRFIDNNSELLNEFMSKLPTRQKIKAKKIEIKKRIVQLRKEGKSYDTIGDKLQGEFEEDTKFDFSYGGLGITKSRFQKLLDRELKKDEDEVRRTRQRRKVIKDQMLRQKMLEGKK